MHVVVSKKDLLPSPRPLPRRSDKKSTMPVLGNVLLRSQPPNRAAARRNGSVRLGQRQDPGKIETGGSIALGARELFDACA